MNKKGLLEEGDVILLGGITFVVYKTAFNGGGTGHGPHDIYPDGHHVYCEKLDDPVSKTDFYQTGCFNGMKPPFSVIPIGKAERTWKFK